MATTTKTTRKTVSRAILKQDAEQQNAEKMVNNTLSAQELHDAIRLKAYDLYVARGYTDGNHDQDWLVAERIVLGKDAV